jgi:hypothetical protein
MTRPCSSDHFVTLLLRSAEVLSACQTELGENAEFIIRKAGAGDASDFLEWFEEWRLSNTDTVVEEIDGAAPYNDTFAIQILKAGPLFWIRANEFDDICYFDSLEDARSCVYDEFEGFINELAERQRGENKDE